MRLFDRPTISGAISSAALPLVEPARPNTFSFSRKPPDVLRRSGIYGHAGLFRERLRSCRPAIPPRKRSPGLTVLSLAGVLVLSW
jgi:hypothetical protein